LGESDYMASMDEKRPLAIYDAAQALDPNAARMDRRRNAHDVLSLQRQTLDRLENELLEGLRGLGDELARSLVEDRAARQAEIRDDLRPQLDELHRQLASAKAELESNRASWEQARIDAGRFEQELRVREILLREAQAQQEHRVSELAMLREQLFDAKAQGSVATERLEQLRREVADRNQNANTADGEAARLRDDAQQLRVLSERQRDEAQQLRILSERQRDELAGFASKSDGLAAENGRLREALEQAQQAAANLANGASSEATQALAELGKAQAQLAANVAEMTQLQGAIEAAQQSSASSADELARAVARQNSAREEVSRLRTEYEAISTQLAAADARLKSAPESASDSEDLQGRLELALDEVRELKRANSDLKSKLDKARTAPGAAAPAAPGGGLDWEAQKQRLLASLEADDEDEPDEERAAEKATIKETIRATDLAIAKKDEEIAELRREVDQLSADSHGISDATAALLDADEIIRQERERLVQLQAEWRDRIGKAEMELSVERARLGRDRAEMADKLQQMGPTANMRPSAPDPNDPGKAGRGRWLSRLGLKEVDEKQGG
jgi:chromosome segregation ATPase